ncbi:hypothetical protein P4689_12340 [Priestia megaterium]|uniref:hypothetical protein n=1 Tax=Priestia megaterium TaxID=1404 RepID=UPI002E24CC56|nr:hypothetical protein [Priestia megaterium]
MKNVQRNYILGIVVLLSFAFFLITMYITDFKNGYSIGVTGVIGIVVVLTSIFQFATWGFDRKVQKDEMGKKVATISAKTSYHILTISLFVLWVADRIIFVRRNDLNCSFSFSTTCFQSLLDT